ncbi:hypothetical protein LNU06_00195 [Campylobacter sp. VicNov18]|uniref:hypothetical protein n=1 Tax=Campylobacter bilis TaxID=2691918 RepID=UPI00130E47B2|nr:hypothetical protein [Campylobacter bilis]MPV62965.1 hypothetical protein [Campylobacter hepaticus]MBM0636464.1 hypothetical protein [Campylobacter bilis]MCC8277173.1 hypothetical protein [Campylobacter bilis]MCC8298916.1 hypothetical protein [Campylobacter bilis]MCC8300082.1 hypothetical protein [Campylobacter bilis]
MKKHIFIVWAVLASSMLFAHSVKIQGTIAQIYDNNKTLLIDSIYGGQMAIKVLPNTEIEMDDCGIFGTDKEGSFKDLKEGNFLESKISYGNSSTPNSIPVARKIEVQCYKKAY